MSKNKNWQTILDKFVYEWARNGNFKEFSKLKTDLERVNFILKSDLTELAPIDDFLSTTTEVSKDEKVACSYRDEGNRLFKLKQFDAARSCYNKCIRWAPQQDGTEYGKGLANRSAVNLYLGQYQDVINDVELALKHNYPDNLHSKLLTRKAQALYHFKFYDEALNTLQIGRQNLLSMENEAKRKTEESEIAKWEKKIKEKIDKGYNIIEDGTVVKVPDVSHGSNPVIVQASNALKMNFTPEKGRHLICSTNICQGDVLIVEKPYAAVLLPLHYDTHCHHCYTTLQAAVPCEQCAMVLYCTDNCRQQSWDLYHHIECQRLNVCHSIGIAHLSLRIVLTASYNYLLGFRHELNELDKTSGIAGLTKEGLYKRNYLTVYDLMPHTEHMPPEDLLQYSLTATLLLKLLENSDFFPEEDSAEQSTQAENKLYIGSLLLRHICQLVCNAHAITALQVDQVSDAHSVSTQSQVRIATAIYPTASLMNHSCDPTIVSSFHKNTLVVKAVKDVEQGGEIYNCYGPHCKRMSYAERQQCLQEQYFFTCDCTACTDDQHTELKYSALLCRQCGGPVPQSGIPLTCMECGQTMSGLDQLEMAVTSFKQFTEAIKLMDNDDVAGSLAMLLEILKKQKQALYKYNRKLGETYDALAKCYSIQENYNESAIYLSESVAITETIYGQDNIETGYELQKYAEVLVNATRFHDADRIGRRARDIFKTNYGDYHDTVNQIDQLCDMISRFI